MDWIGQIALAMLIVGLFAWLRADLTSMRKELRGELQKQATELRGDMQKQRAELRGDIQEQGTELRGDISLLGKEVAGLRERMAHMEGLLEGLRDAVAGKRAA